MPHLRVGHVEMLDYLCEKPYKFHPHESHLLRYPIIVLILSLHNLDFDTPVKYHSRYDLIHFVNVHLDNVLTYIHQRYDSLPIENNMFVAHSQVLN